MNNLLPRRGDIFECLQCHLQFAIAHSADWPELQAQPMRCICGEIPVLLQSGCESAQESGINKIIEAELRVESGRSRY